jgi:RNA polymerase sigma-70 factor (ECF subfamily)
MANRDMTGAQPGQLIQRAQADDREAFAGLFEQYKNLVFKTAYLMFGNRDEAEDALQEVFILVHRSLPGFDPHKGAFSTWLHRITVNYCLNQHRNRHALMISLEDVPAVFANEFPGEQLAEKEAIEQAINGLSDRQKVVVILRYYWELPYSQISEILDIPLGTVKSRLDLALRTMRKLLSGQNLHADLASEVKVQP